MSEAGIPVYVVGEDEVHRALSMALVDATIQQLAAERDASWVGPDLVRWSALSEPDRVDERRRWGDIHATPEVRVHGFLDGQPCQPAARKLRAAIVAQARAERAPGLIVLMQDTDGADRIVAGAEQVMRWAENRSDLPPAVIGTPHRDAEAWFFAAPGIDRDQPERLAEARRVLRFDPTREPERLTARPNDGPTDAKRVTRYVLLAKGDALGRGKPASKSPSPDDADALAARLASDLGRLASFKACALAPFVAALERAVATTLDSHLPPSP